MSHPPFARYRPRSRSPSTGTTKMRVDLFDFELPEDRIALRPATPRESARLLQVSPGTVKPGPFSPADMMPGTAPLLSSHTVAELPGLLRPGDALVFNDTRVIPAALEGQRLRNGISAGISFNLIKRIDARTWRAFARPAKKLEPGDQITLFRSSPGQLTSTPGLTTTITAKLTAGEVELQFERAGPDLDAAIAEFGAMPLPPYIALKRAPDAADVSDYQTMFAARDGAVAAPTAALHFTPALLDRLNERGISHHMVTLHVGAGTFLPVKTDDTTEHPMHSEWGEISTSTVDRLAAVERAGGRIIAVGTTSLRILESAARKSGRLAPFTGDTDIFITPGYRFATVDGLITNFHLPRSTLFMLVAALSGLETMHAAYAHAIAQQYRFYSYGDASLLWPQTPRSTATGEPR